MYLRGGKKNKDKAYSQNIHDKETLNPYNQ